MAELSELEAFLNETYKFENFDDYCVNGLVVEGKRKIKKMGFGVSFNAPFLERSINSGCDAILVHHGIFQKRFFTLKGIEKNKVKKLLNNDISLFGIHLPMDAHPQIGHNALLMKSIGAEITEPLKWGFFGKNKEGKSIKSIIDILHEFLHPEDFTLNTSEIETVPVGLNEFNLNYRSGFMLLENGPEVPDNIFIASGGSTDLYEEAVAVGADTFICGEIKEHIPAISLETGTNFINLGHYYSERPGIIALMNLIKEKFNVDVEFIEVPNLI